MKYLKTFEGLARTDSKIDKIDRTKSLTDEEFISILKENCSNFSLDNDALWRSKRKKYNLELFTPNYRNADPLAFRNFFNKIEKDPDYPVIRKMSLIGGTNKDIVKKLVGADMYQVIPFDNSEIVFCPVVDLWAMDDERGKSSELVHKKPVGKEHFTKVTYDRNFKIPVSELESLRRQFGVRGGREHGYEFFTSSPCLLVHESKLDWLNNIINK